MMAGVMWVAALNALEAAQAFAPDAAAVQDAEAAVRQAQGFKALRRSLRE